MSLVIAAAFAQMFAHTEVVVLTMATINLYLDRRRSKADGRQ